MIATMEFVWEQTVSINNIFKKNYRTKRANIALLTFTYNYLDLESKYYLNRKEMNIVYLHSMIKYTNK